jgi:hypothetical protein
LKLVCAFLLGLTVDSLVATVPLDTVFYRFGRLTGGSHFRVFERPRYLLKSWSGSCGRSVGLDNPPPSDNVASPHSQSCLPGREPGPLSFRGGRVASYGAHTTMLGCPLCKSRLRIFPLYTKTVVRRVVAPAATALRLYPRGRASTTQVRGPTRDKSGLRFECPKCWHRLHSSGFIGATYVSNVARTPQR